MDAIPAIHSRDDLLREVQIDAWNTEAAAVEPLIR
jgi:hypothetical protein